MNNKEKPVMKTLIVAFAILGAAPALAQNPLTTTQSPPAGNSGQSSPNTTNSLLKAAGTETPTQQPGSAIGDATPTQSPPISLGNSAAPPAVTR